MDDIGIDIDIDIDIDIEVEVEDIMWGSIRLSWSWGEVWDVAN